MKKIFTIFILCAMAFGAGNFKKLKEKVHDELYLIMTRSEVKEFNSIETPEELKKFVFSFWKKRDPNPATPQNKVKDVYYARLKFAAKNFREPDKKGWLTDRGRIFLILGPPTDRYLRLMNEERTLGYNTEEEDSVTLAITSGHGFVPNAFQPEEKAKGPNQEKWVYQDIKLTLYFVDENGDLRYRLYNPPSKLLSYMEDARKYFLPRHRLITKLTLSAEADAKAKKLYIHIPLQDLFFIEKGKQLYSIIRLDLYYTRSSKEKPREAFTKEIKFTVTRKQISNPENRVTIPLNLNSFKGTYIIYIHVRDLLSDNEVVKKYRLKI